MYSKWSKRAATVSSLALLLACGDRIETTDMPLPSVEINRQGMDGAKPENSAQGVSNDTASMGAVPGSQPPATLDPDVQIAADVKARLASSPDFGATKIDVHSADGVVTLRGQAPDPAARERATDIARSVREVKSVENLLTLG